MQHLDTCLRISEADRVLCHLIVLTAFSRWIHKMKYSWYQQILLLFVAGLFIGLRRLTKSNRESSFSKLSLLHLAGCVSSPGSLSNLITM